MVIDNFVILLPIFHPILACYEWSMENFKYYSCPNTEHSDAGASEEEGGNVVDSGKIKGNLMLIEFCR